MKTRRASFRKSVEVDKPLRIVAPAEISVAFSPRQSNGEEKFIGQEAEPANLRPKKKKKKKNNDNVRKKISSFTKCRLVLIENAGMRNRVALNRQCTRDVARTNIC